MRNRIKPETYVEEMDLKRTLGYFGAIILLLLGVLFLMASAYVASRIYVGLGLTAIAVALIYYLRRPTKMEITEKREVSLSGRVSLEQVKCPNCAANLDIKTLEIRHGVPSIECPYCGKVFEVSEEPKW